MPEFIKKSIEIEMVKLDVEFSREFFEHLRIGKENIEKNFNIEMGYGEYIERAMTDLLDMVDFGLIKKNINKNGEMNEEKQNKENHTMYG